MAIAKRSYSVTNDTLLGSFNKGALDDQLRAAPLVGSIYQFCLFEYPDTIAIYTDPGPTGPQQTEMDGVVAAHDGTGLNPAGTYPNPPDPILADVLIRVVQQQLTALANYDLADITAFTLPGVYSDPGVLPTPPPTGSNNPAFALINLSGVLGVVYWDFVSEVWMAPTSWPWHNNVILPTWLINQDNSVGAGANSWQYAMGVEFHFQPDIPAGLKISSASCKFGGVSQQHSWALRRSTIVGSSQPALTSYTDVIVTGLYTHININTWEEITGFGGPYTTAPNEWYVLMAYQGIGQGQTFQIATERANGNLNENYADVNAGVYIYDGSGIPGINPPALPVTRNTSNVFGSVSVKFSP